MSVIVTSLHESDCMTKIVATKLIQASTLVFFLAVLGFADSAGSGEPGGSVGGLGALSTSGSGSKGIEGLLETPKNNRSIKVAAIFCTWGKLEKLPVASKGL